MLCQFGILIFMIKQNENKKQSILKKTEKCYVAIFIKDYETKF